MFDQLTFIYIASCMVIILIGWIVRLEIRIKRLLLGRDSKSLEDSIVETKKNIERLNRFENDSKEYFLSVEKRLKRSIQAVNTLRYNPFRGTGDGGNQSFSTSFVSENGNGVVISSLYSRDRVSVFSKPLEKFTSTFELSEEEKESLQNSKKNLAE